MQIKGHFLPYKVLFPLYPLLAHLYLSVPSCSDKFCGSTPALAPPTFLCLKKELNNTTVKEVREGML